VRVVAVFQTEHVAQFVDQHAQEVDLAFGFTACFRQVFQ
jgi:hypothetical protein